MKTYENFDKGTPGFEKKEFLVKIFRYRCIHIINNKIYNFSKWKTISISFLLFRIKIVLLKEIFFKKCKFYKVFNKKNVNFDVFYFSIFYIFQEVFEVFFSCIIFNSFFIQNCCLTEENFFKCCLLHKVLTKSRYVVVFLFFYLFHFSVLELFSRKFFNSIVFY